MSRNPNRMIEAVQILTARFQAFASILVTYQQGATTITGIPATPGRTFFDVMIGEVMTAYESRPYSVETSLLNGLTPQNGDIITEPNGRQYEVAVPKGLNLFEKIGPTGSTLMIHTKAMS